MKPWLRWTFLTCLVLALILVPFALWKDPIMTLSAGLLAPASSRTVLSGVVVLLLASDVLLPVPSSFVSAGAVALLGAWQGGAAVALGMTLGAWVGYGIGLWGGEPLVQRLVGPAELERARRMMERFGSWLLLLGRGLPVLAEASTLLAGATRLSVVRFGVVTALGNLGLAVAYATIAVLDLGGAAALLAPFAFGVAVPGLALLALRGVARSTG